MPRGHRSRHNDRNRNLPCLQRRSGGAVRRVPVVDPVLHEVDDGDLSKVQRRGLSDVSAAGPDGNERTVRNRHRALSANLSSM